jgi:ribose transport system permease protein
MSTANVETEPRTEQSPSGQGGGGMHRAEAIVAHGGRFALVAVLIVLIAVFGLLKPDTFFTGDNFKSILTNETSTLLLALGAMLPLIVAQYDLSIASVFTFSQVMTVGLIINQHSSVGIAIAAGLAGALLVGLVNGLLVVKGRISSFIVTLATGSIVGGATLWYSKGQSIFGSAPTSFTNIARQHLFGFALPVFYALIVIIILVLILNRMPSGRKMYAIGSNERAAALTGINTQRYVMASFLACSFLAGVGGVLLGSSVGAATSESGSSLLIPSFAAAFLGATAFYAGRFNPLGTAVAVYLVAVLINGLQQLGASLWVTPVLQGATLLLAIGLSAWTVSLRQRLARRARLRTLEEDAKREEVGPPPLASAS